MAHNGLNQPKKRRVMRRCYVSQCGKCNRCGCEVGMLWMLSKDGWELHPEQEDLIHPDGRAVAVATLYKSLGGWVVLCRRCNR